ncbi:glycogen/starch synthase [Anaerolinea sp.]|uniref:glycogen synthase n=1 Tax=Anaerolinea sp. TaxID=1872519 RepID=UPI002ACDBE3A|nr:glycogen/starch synthase [Anaerolinea sp.]
MAQPFRVLMVSAEAEPYVKVGGLGDVAGSLPKALLKLPKDVLEGYSLDVRLVLPFHPVIPREVAAQEPLVVVQVPKREGTVEARIYLSEIAGYPVYLIDGEPISRASTVYSLDSAQDADKYIFFSLAVLEMIQALGWKPHVLHAHDWHTAIAVYELARRRDQDDFYRGIKSLFTIHNLPYMGAGAEKVLPEYGIPPSEDIRLPWWGKSLPLPMALSTVDFLSTVSPTYSREILTSEFGCGLEDFLRSRSSTLFGILNGLDTQIWNPQEDSFILRKFSAENPRDRLPNKQALLDQLGLVPEEEAPLLGLIGRFDRQKGIDLAIGALRMMAEQPWQAVLLGSGDPVLEESARNLEREFPERVRVVIKFDLRLSHQIYAGADMLLMPSRYEPCGLAQMIAMRYGCIPVARATGGLRDTISDLPDPSMSTGFLFNEAIPEVLAEALRRAIVAYEDSTGWEMRQRNAMQQDFSWSRSAQEYYRLYRLLWL